MLFKNPMHAFVGRGGRKKKQKNHCRGVSPTPTVHVFVDVAAQREKALEKQLHSLIEQLTAKQAQAENLMSEIRSKEKELENLNNIQKKLEISSADANPTRNRFSRGMAGSAAAYADYAGDAYSRPSIAGITTESLQKLMLLSELSDVGNLSTKGHAADVHQWWSFVNGGLSVKRRRFISSCLSMKVRRRFEVVVWQRFGSSSSIEVQEWRLGSKSLAPVDWRGFVGGVVVLDSNILQAS
ncbi:hypothetical protein KFK09_022956 [Dendrobium nobile]|uniref:Uncharacterized protein n=1 Tax=Dendrobium nobile TaxID=94219 RepID=A0A8T3ARB2_DENNO|nr:hypothetical protein KFK09_022956 [Dendrobium nobile]